MSEETDHAFYVKCEAQLIAAQAEIVELRRWKDIALADHAIIEELQAGIKRLRTGLLDLQHTAAVGTMSDHGNSNADRAAFASFEQRIKALLQGGGVDDART